MGRKCPKGKGKPQCHLIDSKRQALCSTEDGETFKYPFWVC